VPNEGAGKPSQEEANRPDTSGLEHDPASSGQPPDKHAPKNIELERDASPKNDSN
jgi:hypothetical protein